VGGISVEVNAQARNFKEHALESDGAEMIAAETKEQEVQSTTTRIRTTPPNLNRPSTTDRARRLLGDSERRLLEPDDSVRLRELDESPTQTEAKTKSFEEEFERENRRSQTRSLQTWLVRFGILAAIGLIVLVVVWFGQLPTRVSVIQPKRVAITETIASSGRVGGTTETNVGAQSQGIVAELYVAEGSRVIRGQTLALIKNDVAEAQVFQAKAAVSIARAQLVQVSRGALSSEVDAAMEQVTQANAQLEQQRAAITQAERNLQQTRSILAQLEAERSLAKKNLDRGASLVGDGIIPRAEYDQSFTTYEVAEKRVEAQKQAIELAQSTVRSALAALKSSEANVSVQRARLRTIQTGARPEDIQVAQERVAETERALRVAQQQAENATVTAPFAGVVTKINAEVGQTVGQTVGTQGVLTLVSVEPEIRLDVDESNLSSLRIGQEAVISSGAFSGSTFRGTISELGAAVDQTRGTIEVKIIPTNPPEWLRPGQTVNVNIITAENANRLLVPQTALIRSGDRTVVFVIKDGRAVEKPVATRQPTNEGVPVIAGLEPQDSIVANAANIKVGERVQAKQKE
jgi:HlyD family secretion protein